MREINLATIDNEALFLAEKYNLGLEVDEFCASMYLDAPCFPAVDKKIRRYGDKARVFHAPFSELTPCAIDWKVRDISKQRYQQSYELAKSYGISKIVIHGGFIPNVYFPVWYINQSIQFWKEFIQDKSDDFVICLENVMEPEPGLLKEIVEGVNDPRIRICLDLGHANVERVSTVPMETWIQELAPYIHHFHLHNNDREWDYHHPLGEGTMDMRSLLTMMDELCEDASFTIENAADTEKSIQFLKDFYMWT